MPRRTLKRNCFSSSNQPINRVKRTRKHVNKENVAVKEPVRENPDLLNQENEELRGTLKVVTDERKELLERVLPEFQRKRTETLALVEKFEERYRIETSEWKRLLKERDEEISCLEKKLLGIKAERDSLEKALKSKKRQLVVKGHLLRGARAGKAKLLRSDRKPVKKQVLLNPLSNGCNGNYKFSARFMACVRFFQHVCLLSFQKVCVALDLTFGLFFNHKPPFTVSPSSISSWNILLGEVDKLALKQKFAKSEFEFHLWGDDSNKGGNERHAFGVHTWDPVDKCPRAYVLGYTLVASSSGEDQGNVEYHMAHNVYGINNVGAQVGDNAKTQTGIRKGLVAVNSKLFGKELYIVGCYPHVVNIMMRRMIYTGFGHSGKMENFNLMQFHFKISWLHKQRPAQYQSLYVALGVLDKAPPLPQQWVDTRWSYFYEHLLWWRKYGKACLQLAELMVQRQLKSDVHFSVWQDVIQMGASPILRAQRALLTELLEKLVMPALKESEAGDPELGFSPGYIARLWPAKVQYNYITFQSLKLS